MKIDGRKAEITNANKEYTTYKAFARKHGYPDAVADDDNNDRRERIKNGDIVTLLVSGQHEWAGDGTLWIVEAAKGERHIINEKGLRILDEQITVLPDESLGGVLREYREVKRKANVGERVRVFGHAAAEGNGIFVVDRLDAGVIKYTVNGDSDWGTPYYSGTAYVVLEPTDILVINGERLRMVDRKASMGERVIITNAVDDALGLFGYDNGQVYEIKGFTGTDPDIWTDGTEDSAIFLEPKEYRTLEPAESVTPLSSRPAAENIVQLSGRLSKVETQLSELLRKVGRMGIDLRVAREDIALIEEGVSDDIAELRDKVAALERFNGEKTVIEAVLESARNTYTPMKTPQKSPQQIRDEIVERAKADVKSLLTKTIDKVPINNGSYTATFIPGPGFMNDFVEFVVNSEKRTVAAIIHVRDNGGGSTVWARGVAKCAPNDVFNAHIGKAVALRRALGLEVPVEYLSAPNPTEVRVGDVVAWRPQGSIRGLVIALGEKVSVDVSGNTWRILPDMTDTVDDTREGAETSATSAQKGAAA